MPQPCSCCGLKNCQLFCSRCKYIYYCSTECQTNDWKNSHQKECICLCAMIIPHKLLLTCFNFSTRIQEIVKPYHPSLYTTETPGLDSSLQVFIAQCTEWNIWKTQIFSLETGQFCKIITFIKYIDSECSQYVKYIRYFMNGSNVWNECSNHEDSSPIQTRSIKNVECDWKKLRQIEQHFAEIESFKTCDPLVKRICNTKRKFYKIIHDPKLRIDITNAVSFGDFVDTQAEKSQNEEVTGTIIGFINTVRCFMPGSYHVTVIRPFEHDESFTMFHHHNISPHKLMHQILRIFDYNDFHPNIQNSINRYDWCHDRNWGESGNLIYFTPTENASKIKTSITKNSRVLSEMNFVYDDEEKQLISIAANMDFGILRNTDWMYGKLFEDKLTNQCFALIVNGWAFGYGYERTREKLTKKYKFKISSIEDTKLKFDHKNFTKCKRVTVPYVLDLKTLFLLKGNQIGCNIVSFLCDEDIISSMMISRVFCWKLSIQYKLSIPVKININAITFCGFCRTLQNTDYWLKKCRQCQNIWYCSRACQKKHWKLVHRYKCMQCAV
eukprot:105066_1